MRTRERQGVDAANGFDCRHPTMPQNAIVEVTEHGARLTSRLRDLR